MEDFTNLNFIIPILYKFKERRW